MPTGTPGKAKCSIDWCDKPHAAYGYCDMHRKRQKNGWDMDKPPRVSWKGAPCQVKGCNRKIAAKGLCDGHYQRRLAGAEIEGPLRRRDTFDWGEWYPDSKGYMVRTRIPYPNGKQESQRQHRVVMAEMIGRELLPHETPHHKNGDRADNRPENLELWSKSQPAGQRAVDKLAWAREIVALYEPLEKDGVI